MAVGRGPVAEDLGEDLAASSASRRLRLQDEHARSFAEDESVPVGAERTAGFGRHIVPLGEDTEGAPAFHDPERERGVGTADDGHLECPGADEVETITDAVGGRRACPVHVDQRAAQPEPDGNVGRRSGVHRGRDDEGPAPAVQVVVAEEVVARHVAAARAGNRDRRVPSVHPVVGQSRLTHGLARRDHGELGRAAQPAHFLPVEVLTWSYPWTTAPVRLEANASSSSAATPDSPPMSRRQNSSTAQPRQLATPRPVTTTRCETMDGDSRSAGVTSPGGAASLTMNRAVSLDPVSAGSHAISDLLRARRVRAVRAAIELAARLDAMADHVAAAVLAVRCERLDRALEAVEQVVSPRRDYLEGLVVLLRSSGHSSSSPPLLTVTPSSKRPRGLLETNPCGDASPQRSPRERCRHVIHASHPAFGYDPRASRS